MSFINEFGKKISDAGQTTIQKTKNLADIAKLNSSISDEEKKISDTYAQIGKQYFSMYADNPEESFKAFVDAIKVSEGKIVEYQNNIKQIKGVAQCPKCGAEVESGALFCSTCGAAMPKPVEPEPESAKPVIYCTACGTAVAVGSKFCTCCGNPMPVITPAAPVAEAPVENATETPIVNE